MQGSDAVSGSLFSYVDLESRVRSDHPLRPIRRIVNEALLTLGADFEAIYAAGVGRPSIPPERLLRALWCGPSGRRDSAPCWGCSILKSPAVPRLLGKPEIRRPLAAVSPAGQGCCS